MKKGWIERLSFGSYRYVGRSANAKRVGDFWLTEDRKVAYVYRVASTGRRRQIKVRRKSIWRVAADRRVILTFAIGATVTAYLLWGA